MAAGDAGVPLRPTNSRAAAGVRVGWPVRCEERRPAGEVHVVVVVRSEHVVLGVEPGDDQLLRLAADEPRAHSTNWVTVSTPRAIACVRRARAGDAHRVVGRNEPRHARARFRARRARSVV